MPGSDVAVDFDWIYESFISPAIEDSGLRPHRADEELRGGIFHKHMFERLALCEYAIADLSMANANVFYELGIRHATRPWSTVLLYQSDAPLPLDVALDAALDYPPDLDRDQSRLDRLRAKLVQRLRAAQMREVDSPVFQLVAGLPTPEVDHRRVDAMLETIDRTGQTSRDIRSAQSEGLHALRRLKSGFEDVRHLEPEAAVALLLSFRALEAWDDMLTLVDEMEAQLAELWLVREQYALALGRKGDFNQAGAILATMAAQRPNSETYGLLGGIYKRHWQHVCEQGGSRHLASGLLARAAEAYLRGFQEDLRDPYPGVNAVLLLRLAHRDREADEIGPVVRYAVRRRLDAPTADYWDHASELELAVLSDDQEAAEAALPAVLTCITEAFQARATVSNLRLMEMLHSTSDRQLWLGELSSEISKLGLLDET